MAKNSKNLQKKVCPRRDYMLCGGYKIDYVNEEAEELVSTSIRSKIEILI